MISLIFFLTLFFIALLIYQIILANDLSLIEGLDNYQPYDTNNPQNAMILAQQNAGNIAVLKQQVDGLSGLNTQVQGISKNVTTLQGQVSQLVTAQKQAADQLTGGKQPVITGT